MQQYFQGVKVEGGMVLIHSKSGLVNYMNGKVAQLEALAVQPVVTERQALTYAQKSLLVKKTIKQYPAELVVAAVPSSSANKDYTLAYKTRIDGKATKGNMIMANVFVDAITGKVLKTISLIADVDVTGTANTLYSGSRPFTIDSFAGGYRLRDYGRNIQTYNGGEVPMDSILMGGLGVDYVNNTSHWNLFNTLSSVTLQTASPGLMSGLGADHYIFFNFSKTAPVTEYNTSSKFVAIGGPGNLPVVTGGFQSILDPAQSYYGTYLNIEFDTVQYLPNTTSTASYHLANTTPGTHSWADTSGNSGNYTISLQENPATDVHWGYGKNT
jgi:hypothetical protein